jgi:hypothetical protein
MAAPDATKGERWIEHLYDLLDEADIRIDQAQQRIVSHRQLMRELAPDGPQSEVSIELHRNLQEGLRLLLAHRGMVINELAHLVRRKKRLLELQGSESR